MMLDRRVVFDAASVKGDHRARQGGRDHPGAGRQDEHALRDRDTHGVEPPSASWAASSAATSIIDVPIESAAWDPPRPRGDVDLGLLCPGGHGIGGRVRGGEASETSPVLDGRAARG